MLTEEIQNKYLKQLFELISIPSISTLSQHKADVERAADWLIDYARNIGLSDAQKLYPADSADNHPVVFAQRIDNPKAPTVLIYGHYDVQPVDPIDQWKSEPFKPEVRNGNIYARGATDDKGQLFTHLAALDILAQEWGEMWPINVKILFEGEEENGSEALDKLVQDPNYKEMFAADMCVISDGPMEAEGVPTIEYGLRGISYMQIDVKLADADLHSGMFGGGVLNPANALTTILAKLIDIETGKILIPGFYDDVVDVTETERENLAKVPYSDKQFLHEAANSKTTWGDADYSVKERTVARPTLDINGIWGGFSGEGAKTIIPAEAHAKVSMRLVANQDPLKIADLFINYVNEIAPKEVDVKAWMIHKGDAVLINIDTPAIKKAAAALEQSFGNPAIYSRSGGSVPVIATIKKHLGINDIVTLNYGLADDAMHSPNEKMFVDNFYKGIETNVLFYNSLQG